MTPEEIKTRVESALQRTDAVERAKANLSGQLQAKKEELAALVKEIRDAGYDPKTLASSRDQLQKNLEEQLVQYEAQLAKAEAAIQDLQKLRNQPDENRIQSTGGRYQRSFGGGVDCTP